MAGRGEERRGEEMEEEKILKLNSVSLKINPHPRYITLREGRPLCLSPLEREWLSLSYHPIATEQERRLVLHQSRPAVRRPEEPLAAR